MARRLLPGLAVALILLAGDPAFSDTGEEPSKGGVPCDDLPGEDAERYNALVDASTQHYANGDYADSIDAIVKLKRICDEDPRLDFNLARSYQRAGNCNMARFWFEELLERVGEDTTALAEDRPRLAQEAIDELSQQCTESARIAMDFEDPDAEIELRSLEDDEAAVFTYPFEGRIDAGEYVMTVRREGKQTLVQRVTIVANDNHIIEVPPLLPESAMGTLTVHCPEPIQSTTLRSLHSPAEPRALPCGQETALTDGSWAVDFELAGHPFREVVEVGLGRHLDLHLTRPEEPDTSLQAYDWGLITITTGSVLTAAGVGIFVAGLFMEVDALQPVGSDPGTGEVTTLEPVKEDIDDRGQIMQIAGLATGGVGLALVLTGIVLVALPEDDDEAPSSTSVGLSPGQSGFQFSIRSHF